MLLLLRTGAVVGAGSQQHLRLRPARPDAVTGLTSERRRHEYHLYRGAAGGLRACTQDVIEVIREASEQHVVSLVLLSYPDKRRGKN